MSEEKAMVDGAPESTDVINLLKDVAKDIREAKADGNVDWKDLPKFTNVVGDLMRAVQGGQKIPGELVGNPEAAIQVAQEVVAAALELVQAVIS